MLTFKLTRNERLRVRRAARAYGFPWQPILERPRTARRFLKRIEAEMARTAGLKRQRLAGTTANFPAQVEQRLVAA